MRIRRMALAHLDWVVDFAKNDSDISDHLETLYTETVQMQPKLIVELGVRDADSSKVLGKANEDCGSMLLGVDIEPCSYDGIHNASFYQMDDIEFAKRFKEFSPDRTIDVLFIDTSHLMAHTVQEIAGFFPLLSDTALVMFHDTNLLSTYTRRNGTTGSAWDNDRGVIRAIEEYFGITFDESTEFEIELDHAGSHWKIKQYPLCNGFMLCWKSPPGRL